ncbi:MAG: amidohydrolase family protein, partial [Alcaligenaceae bacterium]|nr:amidohydrolase family protein [Alcaligenaceae bacterium]
MSIRHPFRLAALSLALLAGQPAIAAELADTIWTGGPIVTINDARPAVEAVAVRDGKILAVGTLSELKAHQGKNTQTIDLQGKTMLPGFVDAHGHAFMIGLQAISANLLAPPDGKVTSIKDLQQTLQAWSKEHASTEKSIGLILGFGYDDAQLAE